MDNNWEKPYEDDGLTLGPEDALRREIEKSKTLKVEKLQLKDTLEKLKSDNEALVKINRSLEQKLDSLTGKSGDDDSGQIQDNLALQDSQTPARGWSFFLLIFNLAAVGFLLIFLLQR